MLLGLAGGLFTLFSRTSDNHGFKRRRRERVLLHRHRQRCFVKTLILANTYQTQE